ncbi:Alpha-1,2-glucosyltransferase ALG10-A [Pelomyxa schiedti]|nr:Alpha-1,2-glucosyltransferase ALG10-A [Pelomyxa schiedti]
MKGRGTKEAQAASARSSGGDRTTSARARRGRRAGGTGALGAGCAWAAALFCVCAAVSAALGEEEPPYMDEVFHVRQTWRYCRLEVSASHWDDKITTLPGLYALGAPAALAWGSLQCLLSSVLWAPSPGGGDSPLRGSSNSSWASSLVECACDVGARPRVLRLVSCCFGILLFPVLVAILHRLDPSAKTSMIVPKVLSCCLFPPLFFFNFLYYTDTGSILFVCLSYLFSLKEAYLMSAIIGALAVFFRQNNIIWVVFIAGEACIRISHEKELLPFFMWAVKNIPEIVKKFWAHALLGVAFAAFVVINGGIVVGDRSHHVVAFHFAQFLYFSLIAAVTLIPSTLFLVDWSTLWARTRTKHQGNSVKQYLLWAVVASALTILFTFLVKNYTFVHPFILADNRHYTFYIWKDLFVKYEYFKYSLVPFYVASFFFLHWLLKRSLSYSWILLYVLCASCVLVTSTLVEMRYFVTPMVILHLRVHKSNKGTWMEVACYLCINSLTIAMFALHPFTWPDGSTARFMW